MSCWVVFSVSFLCSVPIRRHQHPELRRGGILARKWMLFRQVNKQRSDGKWKFSSGDLMKRSIHFNGLMLTVCLLIGGAQALAAEYAISPEGDDQASGSSEQPIRSFARAADLLQPGDTLHLLAGTYLEPIDWNSLRGTADQPIRIVGSSGTVLDGTQPLEGRWTPNENGIWTMRIDFDIWQLFAGDRLVYLARWPDATFEDGSKWRMTRSFRAAEGGFDRKQGTYFGKSRDGWIYDRAFLPGTGDGFHEGDSRYEVEQAQLSLADSGKDFTGAIAVLNLGHWLTWARPIKDHEVGSDHFRYEQREMRGLNRFFAWYVLGRAALDKSNEWWFEADTQTIYFMPPAGEDPNLMAMRGKRRDFAVVLDQCAHLEFEDIDIFGAAFFLDDCEHITFEDCRFRYSATHKFGLGQFDWVEWDNRGANQNKLPSIWNGHDNTFTNCEFSYCNSPIYFGGTRARVENCLFHDIEWDLNSNGGSGSIMIGKDGTFRRNTVFRTGNSEGIRPVDSGCRIELNRIFDMGNLQHDGSAINVGTTKHLGCLVAHNWAHDNNRQGIRFDYAGGWDGVVILRPDGLIHGDGVYRNNVTWNTEPNQVKGDRHLVLNNTVISVNRYPAPSSEKMTMSIQGFKCMHSIDGNAQSITCNNLANLTHRSWNLQSTLAPTAATLPGVASHNMRERGAAYKYLRDPKNYDFRPRKDSPLVDGGRIVTRDEVKSRDSRFDRITYVGNSPDIGAYEYGDHRYWIPGRRETTACTPIPRDDGTEVPLDADLMFLEAYGSQRHQVYFGLSSDQLELIAELNRSTNIVKPPALQADTVYFWRVDSVDSDGTPHASPIWSFTTTKM